MMVMPAEPNRFGGIVPDPSELNPDAAAFGAQLAASVSALTDKTEIQLLGQLQTASHPDNVALPMGRFNTLLSRKAGFLVGLLARCQRCVVARFAVSRSARRCSGSLR